MGKSEELQTLKRGLKAISLINSLRYATTADMARRLKVPRTTTERLLMTLHSEGFIARDPDTKLYFLTARVHDLSDGYDEESKLVFAARPMMVEKTREIGWPLCLAVPMGEYMTIRVTTDNETTLGINRRHVGSTGAMGLVSSGFAFLAFLEGPQRKIMLELLRRSSDASQEAVHDAKRMAYLIEQVQETGYSFGVDRGQELSVAVPVMLDGRVRAALQMPFMARVLSTNTVVERFVPQLKELAAAIERATATPCEAVVRAPVTRQASVYA